MSDLAIALTPGIVVGSILQIADEQKTEAWPSKAEDLQLQTFDTGVFVNELVNLEKLPTEFTNLSKAEEKALETNPDSLLPKAIKDAPGALDEGTYRGTQLALTKLYDTIEKR
jgi:hypothetical protein